MFLGYRLRLLRRSRALSQTDLGKILGVSKVSISGYENGTRIPSLNILMSILNYFNISADYMLGREYSVVCENMNEEQLISKNDLDIIRTLRKKRMLYNKIAINPDRFFSNIDKK